MATVHYTKLFSAEALNEAHEQKLVRVQSNNDESLFIWNYTEKATYDRVWNDVTRNCRGLILDSRGNVVARPWKKFMNYSEHPEGTLDLDAPVEVTDKMDGSLGILYFDRRGKAAVATRGSFNSDQAVHATELYRRRYDGHWNPSRTFTYLFEIIYPGNRIVLDYGTQDDLVLLGAVNISTGRYYSPKDVPDWPGQKTPVFAFKTLAEALEAKPRANAEGLVVRYKDKDEMVKLKQEDYVALHRIVTGLNERIVWEHLGSGGSRAELLKPLPEEFHPWVHEVADRLLNEAKAILSAVDDEFKGIISSMEMQWSSAPPTREDRKEFAARVLQSEHKSYLFSLLDRRDIWEDAWKAVKPSGANKMTSYSEDTA